MGVEAPLTPDADEESALLPPSASAPPPEDAFNLAYTVYFTLGTGFLLPWNAFITAVDYFSYLYPSTPVDRVFSVAYMFTGLLLLVLIIGCAHRAGAAARINTGLALFVVALLVPPAVDGVYVKGRVGLYSGYDVTVFAVVLSGLADALVQSGVIGSAGEMPERYMQAVFSGTATSGVLVSFMRIGTKALFPQDPSGLRKSANLYFIVSIVMMIICLVCYNVADRLPVVQYYKDMKRKAVIMEREEKGTIAGSNFRSSLWEILGHIKWYGLGIFLIYVVTLSIFPGYITENVHSAVLKDWYPIILITSYNVFDLIGKSLPAIYVLQNASIAVWASIARLLFFPLYLACLHGPEFFRTEILVTLITCLLGLTNGYFTSILTMHAPKTVPIQHSEMAGFAIVLFLVLGLVVGSVVSWVWVI